MVNHPQFLNPVRMAIALTLGPVALLFFFIVMGSILPREASLSTAEAACSTQTTQANTLATTTLVASSSNQCLK